MNRWVEYVQTAKDKAQTPEHLLRHLKDIEIAMKFEHGRAGVGKRMEIDGLGVEEYSKTPHDVVVDVSLG